MKRFHVSVGVSDLDASVEFYRNLFGAEPTVLQADYAKWMLDDPRVNFAINAGYRRGVNHVGLQADTPGELAEIQARLRGAHMPLLDEPDVECCYARSSKTWVRDPDDLQWETFVTHRQTAAVGGGEAARLNEAPPSCCGG